MTNDMIANTPTTAIVRVRVGLCVLVFEKFRDVWVVYCAVCGL